MNEIKRVLIVGSGIGGATAAYALRRVGIDVHCIDIKPESSSAGSGICLLHNTLRALDMIGLAQPCLESGMRFESFLQFDSAGQLLRSNPAPRVAVFVGRNWRASWNQLQRMPARSWIMV